jgi:hypothetical protein
VTTAAAPRTGAKSGNSNSSGSGGGGGGGNSSSTLQTDGARSLTHSVTSAIFWRSMSLNMARCSFLEYLRCCWSAHEHQGDENEFFFLPCGCISSVVRWWLRAGAQQTLLKNQGRRA